MFFSYSDFLFSSLNGLSVLNQLEHLDVSHNKISVIEGLEMLTNMRTLLINNNNIHNTIDIRSLSCNRYVLIFLFI